MQYSLNEVCLLPSSKPTDIISRSQVNPFTMDGNLPVFVAPMTSVIDSNNFELFKQHKFIPILPRNCSRKGLEWKAYSLVEITTLCEQNLLENSDHVLIDIANGHQERLYDIVRLIKSTYPGITIMIGNIAHPDMYLECCKAGVDYVRVGIGGGSVCSTSVQCGIHASHQWMIEGIKEIQKHIYQNPDYTYSCTFNGDWEIKCITKVIADGGINTLDKAIKCLAIGYDYVMMGKCFAQCEEACGEVMNAFGHKERKYYGMASEQGQIDISGGANKNPEGIETWVPIDTNLEQFSQKFEAALRSTMSYVGAHNLEELKTKTQYDIMSIEEFKSYYK